VPVKSDPATWKDPRQVLGLAGERVAAAYLRRRGWQLLAHRFRMGRLEVDLIARKGTLVIFVEVKTRQGDAFGGALRAVGWRKQQEITRVASAWLDRRGRTADRYRFDVVAVDLSRCDDARVQHIEDAYRPGWR
jgi:putative endonuclease